MYRMWSPLKYHRCVVTVELWMFDIFNQNWCLVNICQFTAPRSLAKYNFLYYCDVKINVGGENALLNLQLSVRILVSLMY